MVNPGFVPEPQQEQSRQPQGNGMAVTGMVIGIVALVLCWFLFLNWVLAVLGIIFSALGIVRARKVGKGKGMAIAGLICAIVGGALGTVISVVAMRSFGEYIEKAKSTEARLSMHAMERKLKSYEMEHNEFPRGNAGPSPAGNCCSEPGKRCTIPTSTWHQGVWNDIGFELFEDRTRYSYDYSSTDGKTFVAHAIGDADCDGEKATWELRGSIDANGLATTQLVEPKAGVY
jgi:hypothetical protein